MDYYVFVTKRCNMKCAYCCENQEWTQIRGFNVVEKPDYDIPDLIKFILKNRERFNDDEVYIILYGGEPLLNQTWIKEFMRQAEEYNFRYALFTNGVLLPESDDYVIERLSYLFVSIDGLEEINDRFRGKGNYRKVLSGLSSIEKKFNGKKIAMMTMTPYNKIYESVLDIVDKFDFIYWKLLSSNELENAEDFKRNYDKGLDLLIDYWIREMKKGRVVGLIPFLAVVTTLLDGIKQENFRCNVGDILVTVDTDGNCYSCDELVDEKHRIGSIYGSIKKRRIPYSKRCKKCEYRYVCGGRCPKEEILFPSEVVDYHCDLTKMLIDKLREKVSMVEELIDKGVVKRVDFNFPHLTSEIP